MFNYDDEAPAPKSNIVEVFSKPGSSKQKKNHPLILRKPKGDKEPDPKRRLMLVKKHLKREI